MDIYLVGSGVLMLGVLFFFVHPQYLYNLMVFSIPFTGTAAFSIPLGSHHAQGIRVSLALGALCLFRYLLSALVKGKITIPQPQRNPLSLLLLLALVVTGSLFMPFHISGDFKVLDSYSNLVMYAEEEPLYFKFQYLTQTLYFVFGVLIAIYIALKNPGLASIKNTIRVYLLASLFVVAWGWVELLVYYARLPYPGYLFNQNSMNYLGTLQLYGLPRVTSVALEPSIFAQQLLTALPFLFWGIHYKIDLLQPFPQRTVLFLTVLILVFCYSSTALVGLVLLGGLISLKLMARRKMPKALLVVIILLLTIILVAIPFVVSELIQKLSDYSGMERLKAVVYGFRYFQEYPWLGIGWGVFPTWDFLICFLAGAGLIGLFTFIWMLTGISRNFTRQKKKGLTEGTGEADEMKFLRTSVIHAFGILLVVSQISGFIYHSQYFWFVLGLTVAVSSVRNRSQEKVQEVMYG